MGSGVKSSDFLFCVGWCVDDPLLCAELLCSLAPEKSTCGSDSWAQVPQTQGAPVAVVIWAGLEEDLLPSSLVALGRPYSP